MPEKKNKRKVYDGEGKCGLTPAAGGASHCGPIKKNIKESCVVIWRQPYDASYRRALPERI